MLGCMSGRLPVARRTMFALWETDEECWSFVCWTLSYWESIWQRGKKMYDKVEHARLFWCNEVVIIDIL